MKIGRIVLIAAAVIAIAAFASVLIVDNKPHQPPKRRAPNQASRELLKILPDDLNNAHAEEIEGILYTFYKHAEQGRIAISARQTVDRKLTAFIQAGEINRTELNLLMAEISHFSVTADPTAIAPDSASLHPLLQQQPDSLRR